MMIVIEGTDAAGKHTQAMLLAKALHGVVYSFPNYETPIGKLIKAHLMKEWEARWKWPLDGKEHHPEIPQYDALMFQALQTANRMEVMPKLVADLESGKAVICDRYWQSGYVYGVLDGLDGNHMRTLHAAMPQAHLNFYIDIDIADSIQRRPERRDRYESDIPYLTKIIDGYRTLWGEHPFKEQYIVINGRQNIDDVHKDIFSHVRVFMKQAELL